MKFRKGNKIIYMQDFGFPIGIPHSIDFKTKVKGDTVILRAPGYGGEPYGNGAIYVKLQHMPKRARYELVREMGYIIPKVS